jgi:virulence-associated protein VapD
MVYYAYIQVLIIVDLSTLKVNKVYNDLRKSYYQMFFTYIQIAYLNEKTEVHTMKKNA